MKAAMRRAPAVVLCATLLLLLPTLAAAQGPANVLVIANSSSPASLEIADYYARIRQVPADQVLRLAMPVTEEIPRAAYRSQIEEPIGHWLILHAAQDRILYIVMTKGVPLRIAGTTGQNGSIGSVDSELTLLYRKLAGQDPNTLGSIPNPYFLGDADVSTAKPFTHEWQDLFLVTRLDGYTTADVKAMIDRGSAPTEQGVILLDQKSEFTRTPGNTWLERAADALKKMPGWSDRVVFDEGGRVLREQKNVLGYFSWGSNDPAIMFRHLGLEFVPGALAGMFVSSDARTFQEPPAGWQVKAANYAGSTQSLIGDLIRDGVTGVAGHVAEPYLSAAIRPHILFPAYVSGLNLAESFYLAMPAVSWQTVVIGDPLCAPFKRKTLTTEEIDRGVDAITEMPRFVSERRVSRLTGDGIKLPAAKLFIKSEVRLLKNDQAGAKQALEEATTIDEGLITGHLFLASMYEHAMQWDSAIDRYRRIIARVPNHSIALNNLAYALAVQKKQPDEALSFAKRAYAASKGTPIIADTLGWIYHLLGNDTEAERLLTAATAGAPDNAEIQLHAATVLAANGRTQPAAKALARALELNKSLGAREDVRQLKLRLGVS